MVDSYFVKYFQRELAYLRSLGQEFVEAYPEVQYVMSERGGDPAAERLFQGVALLTARLRQRIEDDLPEISHPFVGRLWPQFLKPTPAVTLLSFKQLPGGGSVPIMIPRGAMVSSLATPRTPSCAFRTTSDLTVLPAVLESVTLARQRAGDLQLRIRLVFSPGNHGTQKVALRLQFLGDQSDQYTLYQWVSSAAQVTVEDRTGAVFQAIPRHGVRPLGMLPEESLWPGALTPLPGLDLLRDYFIFPEKYLGVEVGFTVSEAISPVDIVFHLGRLPDPGFEIDTSLVALGCVPAVNVSEPIELEILPAPGSHRFRLDLNGDLFEVIQVRAYDMTTREWTEVPPLAKVAAQSPLNIRYEVLRLEDGVAGLQSYLVTTDAEGRPSPPAATSLQVLLRRTDGAIPGELAVNTVTAHGSGTPGVVTFTNVVPVRPGRPLRLHEDRLWRLLAMLGMHPFDLYSLNGVRNILGQSVGGDGERGHRLLEVYSGITTTIFRRTAIPVRNVRLVFDDAGFVAPGRFLLFARVLSRLFEPLPGTLMFSEVTVRGEPSGVEHHFSLAPAPEDAGNADL